MACKYLWNKQNNRTRAKLYNKKNVMWYEDMLHNTELRHDIIKRNIPHPTQFELIWKRFSQDFGAYTHNHILLAQIIHISFMRIKFSWENSFIIIYWIYYFAIDYNPSKTRS